MRIWRPPLDRTEPISYKPGPSPAEGLAWPAGPGMPSKAQVAQLVEQRTENPRVGGSNPPLGTIFNHVFKLLRDY